MKRFLTMIVAVCSLFAASAQYPLVTLSHNGELSFFDNLYAFESAYDAAVNGDTIYLSKGEFVLNGGSFTIGKRLSIVGSGYDSHLLGDITVNMSSNPNSEMEAPLFDGLKIDHLTFYDAYSSLVNLGTSKIVRCAIGMLHYGGQAGKNVIYDKCYMGFAGAARFGGEGAITVTNSKVWGNGIHEDDKFHNITAINCNISNACYYPRTMISCIHRKYKNYDVKYSGTHSIINSVLDYSPSDPYMHDCYIYDPESQPLLDDNLDCPLNLEELGYLGQDGTVVGCYGGVSPYSENPSVPTVDSDKSSVEYDAENNKLKVSITVKAD